MTRSAKLPKMIIVGMVLLGLSSCGIVPPSPVGVAPTSSGSALTGIQRTDEQWKSVLTPEQYGVLREKGTERPFTGALLNEHRKGTFYSVGCDDPVFRSETKYDSGTGWPSFYAPIAPDALVLQTDKELGYERTEVLDKCGGHLGHVFDDGPRPTGKRYCMNSIALYFVPDRDQ